LNVNVLISAFNEERLIGGVITNLKNTGITDILIIDDGSCDNTADIARKAGAEVISHTKNLGKGACIKIGLEHLHNKDIEGVVLMDGDGQHNPFEVNRFLECAKDPNKKIIIGNRMTEHKSMPLLRLATNKVMSFALYLLCGQKVPDTQCGYRFFRKEVLDDIYKDIISGNYEIESEMVLKAANKGHKIYSVPITTIYQEETSRIDPIKDTVRFIKLVIRFLLSIIR